MTFVGKGVLFGEHLRDRGDAEDLPEQRLLILSDDIPGVSRDDIVVSALGGLADIQRLDAAHIGVGAGLQVRRKVAGGKEGVQAVQDVTELGVLLLQRLAPRPAPDQQNEDVDGKQDNEDDLQHHAGVVGVPDHGLGHALREGLDQDILAVGDAEHAQVIRQAPRLADKARVLRALLKGLPDQPGGPGVDTARALQYVGQGPVIAAAAGAGDHGPVPGAQKGVRRLAEVVGGQHIPEVFLRVVDSQQHPDGLAVMLHRGVKYRHGLPGQPGAEHLQAALPTHPVDKIVPVTAVAGLPVGGQIDPPGVSKEDGVEGRVLLHALQQSGGNLRLTLARAQQIGVVADPQKGVVELALDPLGHLTGGIHSIIQVLMLDPPPVGCGIPLEQQADCRQQDTDIQHILPGFALCTHIKSPLSVTNDPAKARHIINQSNITLYQKM